MRVLVVSGAGYVGSHCLRQLTAAGHRGVVLDNLIFGHRAAVAPAVPFDRADLTDEARAELGWQPQYPDVEAIVAGTWKWHMAHPAGYGG
jgi:UDP-glucose 4-epimerase